MGGELLAYALGVVLIFIIGKLFLKPVKWVFKLVLNGLIGGICLVVLNAFGSGFGLHIPLNIISCMVTGFLGVPGVVLLLILQIFK